MFGGGKKNSFKLPKVINDNIVLCGAVIIGLLFLLNRNVEGAAFVEEGGTCNNPGDCAQGLYCHPTTKKCVQRGTRSVNVGGSCTPDGNQCMDDLVCDNQTCKNKEFTSEEATSAAIQHAKNCRHIEDNYIKGEPAEHAYRGMYCMSHCAKGDDGKYVGPDGVPCIRNP